jgi:hypothetical protein
MPTIPDQQPRRPARPTASLSWLGRLRIPRILLALGGSAVLVALLLLASLGSAERVGRGRGRGRGGAVARPGGHTAAGPGAPVDAPVPGWPVASVRLTGAPPRQVPASFLNLSTEYWTLPHYANERRLFTQAINLLRRPGIPFTLRIGGESADLSWWDPRYRRAPNWSYPLSPAWLSDVARLVTAAHLHVVLDLNLANRDPAQAAQFAKAVYRRLPPGSLQALEIGNEPDLYPKMATLGLATVVHSRVVRYFAWADRYAPDPYVRQFNTYLAALHQVGVDLPVGGPEISDPTQTQWLTSLIAGVRGRLAFISAHRYPLNACEGVRSAADYPTIRRLLANSASAGLAAGLRPAVAIASRAGLPFALTEFNSVTCGGTAAVSGTFANALWAPDALFSLMRVGVNSVDLHLRARAFNAPFFVTGHGLRPRPILYGFVLFERMLGSHSFLMPSTLRAPARTLLRAWVVRGEGTERVLLINKGSRGADFRLALGGMGVGRVERLRASGPAARTGVTLAGLWVTPGGRWRGHFRQETVLPHAGRYEVPVPGYSAALVTVRLPGHR